MKLVCDVIKLIEIPVALIAGAASLCIMDNNFVHHFIQGILH